MKNLLSLLIFILCLGISTAQGKGADMTGLNVSSPAFASMGQIPAKYTCDGSDVNPPLKWEGVPAQAKSLALIVDDPDAPAGTWVHWVMWNIDTARTEIAENSVPKGAVQGMTDFRKQAYGGPCPPSGSHRYFFKLYALDTVLNIPPRSSKADLEKAMKGHIVANAELVGTYKRK